MMTNIVLLLLFLVASSCSTVFCTTQFQSSAPEPEDQLASNGASTRTTLPMLITIFIISLFISAFCTIYIRYCSYRDQYLLPQTTRGVSRGIDPRVLATCPVVSYSALKLAGLGINTAPQNAAFQCAVCLAEFEDGEEALRLLPRCGHVFHRSCIDAWLAAHVTCPVCRGEVSVETEGDTRARHVFEESSSVKGFGVLLRSYSTGHSLESFNLGLPEEMMTKKVLEESERGSVMTRMKRSASYDVVLRSVEGGEGSNRNSNGKSNNDSNRWVLSRTQPFVSRGSGIPRFWDTSVREEKECGGRNFQCQV